MAKFNQFGSAAPGLSGGTRDCLRYEAMLADVLDGTLSAEEQTAFDQHRATCDSCSEMLADAQRGAAWLALLKPERPEPSATLVDRILSETSVRSATEADAIRIAQRAAAEAALLLGPSKITGGPASVATAFPALPLKGGNVLPFRARVPAVFQPALTTILQPRFAMTAAMAFFSVALTLNLTGIHISTLHARDLRPASLRRSFYETNAHAVRYYESLRVVYELESRVRDLQHGSDTDPAASAPQPSASPAGPDGKPGEQLNEKTGRPAAPAQTKPSGKAHSGLSGGAESRGRNAGSQPYENNAGVQLRNERNDGSGARRRTTSLAPQGAIVPVSLSPLSPDRQKRGLA